MRHFLPIAALILLPQSILAQQTAPDDWPRVKCEIYTKATAEALQRFGRTGLGVEFLARHEAFLAGGCAGERDVCPKSPEELRLANALVIRGMNAGMASTFFPFGCPKGR
ncbi:MAG: hypothetical protein O9322_02685 [Beijerinckiaceae bacterium]|nr:hypothetical protein [Beijerinckiaceae bacterium]MCZ8301470.1 hypothetical protein [Beijerinckiaceae bacterium]